EARLRRHVAEETRSGPSDHEHDALSGQGGTQEGYSRDAPPARRTRHGDDSALDRVLHESVQSVFPLELVADGCSRRGLFDVHRGSGRNDAAAGWTDFAVPDGVAGSPQGL